MVNISKLYTIQVVPLVSLPIHKNAVFSYTFTEDIPEGSLVLIPFSKRILSGIVVKTNEKSIYAKNLKSIIKVLSPKKVTQKQLKLASFVSQEYFAPLGIVLKSFVPKSVKSRKEYPYPDILIKKINLTPSQRKAVQKIVDLRSSIRDKRYYLYGPASSGKTEVYIEAIKKLCSQSGQSLVIVPELTLASQAIMHYSSRIPRKDIVVLHSKLTQGQFYQSWKAIASGKAKVIIGSRTALFAPFKNIKLVVIDEEQDMSHKQWDMTPRYDGRAVAMKLAQLHGAAIVYGSATPSIEYYLKTKNKELQRISLPPLKLPSKKNCCDSKIVLVDMKKESWNFKTKKGIRRVPLISKELKDALGEALRQKVQSLLLVNRQGMSAYSVCIQCKSPLKCPQCERALVLQKSDIYQCLHCTYKTDIFPKCRQCGGMQFQNLGIGTQKIERAISQIFPQSRIKRVDATTMQKTQSQEKLYTDMLDRKIDILIGTQMITKGWNLPRLSVIGIIEADSLWSIPDYSSDEQAFQLLLQAVGRIGRVFSEVPGTAYIQTYHPESEILQAVVKKDVFDYYEQELEERKILKYPPYYTLFRIVVTHTVKSSLEKQVCTLHKNLIEELPNGSILLPPTDPLKPKIRSKYRKFLIIKVKNDTKHSSTLKKLKDLLRTLPKNTYIEKDPIGIL